MDTHEPAIQRQGLVGPGRRRPANLPSWTVLAIPHRDVRKYLPVRYLCQHPRPSQPAQLWIIAPSLELRIVSAELLSFVARQKGIILAGEFRCISQLVFRNAGFVAANPCIVVELFPRNCVLFGTHAQKSTESRDCIYDMAAEFFDNEALDCADLLAIYTVNSGAFDTVTFDKWVTRS